MCACSACQGPLTPGCECLLDDGYTWADAGCSIDRNECSAITYSASCKADHGSHSHSSSHTATEITCACDDGYTGISEGNCKPTPVSGVANAIQNAAPEQSCDIEIWHNALGALAGALTGEGGGQTDCSGSPDLSGDCVETIEDLLAGAGPEAEFAADIISKLTGTNAKEICTEICVQGCLGVLGWAMSPASPCILDAAPIATVRIICLPPWGLVAVVCILLVLKACGSACADDKPARSSQPLSIPLRETNTRASGEAERAQLARERAQLARERAQLAAQEAGRERERAEARRPAAALKVSEAAVVVASAAAPEPAPTFAGDLTAVLKAARLSEFEDALRELGCAVPEDLGQLEEGDLVELGMKKIEVKRLMRFATP